MTTSTSVKWHDLDARLPFVTRDLLSVPFEGCFYGRTCRWCVKSAMGNQSKAALLVEWAAREDGVAGPACVDVALSLSLDGCAVETLP